MDLVFANSLYGAREERIVSPSITLSSLLAFKLVEVELCVCDNDGAEEIFAGKRY